MSQDDSQDLLELGRIPPYNERDFDHDFENDFNDELDYASESSATTQIDEDQQIAPLDKYFSQQSAMPDEDHQSLSLRNEDEQWTTPRLRQTTSRVNRSNQHGSVSFVRNMRSGSIRSIASARAGSVRQHSARYKNTPELSAHFERVQCNGSSVNQCKHCNYIIKAHMSSRLIGHLAFRCLKAPESVSEHFKAMIQDTEYVDGNSQNTMNMRFARIIIKHNIPLRILSCNLFTAFIKDYCRGKKLASRERMAEVFIGRMARKIDERFSEMLKSAKDYSLSIEFDHWTDATHRSILGIVATTFSGGKHLIQLEDVSISGHSSDQIVSSIIESLKSIPCIKINSIVSDNASSCASARSKLVGQNCFRHLIQHRCMAHWLNLIGLKICAAEGPSEVVESCNRLVNFLSNDKAILAKMKEAGAKRCKRSIPTRWYTTVNMLESLIEIRECATTIIRQAHSSSNDQSKAECLLMLECDRLWPDISSLVSLLRPIADCIALSEARDGDIGRAMRCVITFAKQILGGNWTDEFNFAAIEAFFTYFSEDKLGEEYGLLLSAYFLDRNNKMDFVTEKGTEYILKTIGKVALITSFRNSQIKSQLVEEFLAFCNQKGSFGDLPSVENEKAFEWWARQTGSGILKQIGSRLACLKSSSSNIERVFSHLKYVQSPNRFQFNLNSLRDIAKIRVADFTDYEIFDGEDFVFRQPVRKTASSGVVSNLISVLRSKRTDVPFKHCYSRPRPSRDADGHRTAQFKNIKLLNSYKLFMEIINFDIVNSFNSCPADISISEDPKTVLSDAVKKLRELKSGRK